MYIKKFLKHASFAWDTDLHLLSVSTSDFDTWVRLNRSQMFSLCRFIIRIAQRAGRRKHGKTIASQ